MRKLSPHLVFWGFNLWVAGYTAILGLALLLQFIGNELPCPLCMLQRYAMILTSLGALWIIREAQTGMLTPTRYTQGLGLGALGALIGAVFAGRQVLLHILPGDAGYGPPEMGLHLYSWAFISFCVVILFCAVMGILATQALPEPPPKNSLSARVSNLIGLAFLLVIAINAVMIVALEGFAWVLPDDPVSYGLFN